MAVVIVHSADLHLDSAFASLLPEQAARRRRSQRELLFEIARVTNEQRADILFLSGDIFDSQQTYRETELAFSQALASVRARVFIAPGNHDYVTAGGVYDRLSLPENVHVFRSESVECVCLPELGCRVYGAGFMAPECRSLLEGFTPYEGDEIALMALHGDLTGGEYDPISPVQIGRTGLDYVALGHIHARSEIRHAADTFYAYPGCPEGRGFDETGPKGVLCGTVDKGAAHLRFLPLPGERYEELRLDVTGRDAMAAASMAVPEDMRLHCRLTLTGRTDALPDAAAIERALAGRCAELTVSEQCSLIEDPWQYAGENSLRGETVAYLKDRYDRAAPEDRANIALAAEYALAALERGDMPEL